MKITFNQNLYSLKLPQDISDTFFFGGGESKQIQHLSYIGFPNQIN